MKLLIIPSCNLPMPPVLGGAVQTLINDFLEWNEISKQFDITVASIYNPAAEMRAQEYIFTKFKFYKNENKTIRTIMEKIVRVVGHYEIGDSFINNVCNDLQKDSYDIILVENVKNYGAIIKRYFSCPVLLHLHNEYFKQNKPNMKRMIASYNSIIAVSSYIKNTVLNCSEMAKVSVLLNGIDKSEFDPSKKNKMLLRQKYGFSGIDTIFISAARICEDKGTLETVKAFNLLSNTSNARAKLIILGSKDYGKTIRDEYFEKVLAEANKCWENRKELCKMYDFDSIEIIDCARINSDMEVIKHRLKKAKEEK